MFRNLLIADLVSDIGTFMQGVGAAWLMVSQGAGPLLVALTQTASAVAVLSAALPAGALGDIFDRRKLIVTTEVWMVSVATAIAALTAAALDYAVDAATLDGGSFHWRCTRSSDVARDSTRSCGPEKTCCRHCA